MIMDIEKIREYRERQALELAKKEDARRHSELLRALSTLIAETRKLNESLRNSKTIV